MKSMLGLQAKSYKHQPLDTRRQQIRLLRLKQDSSGPVRCTLEAFDLGTAPPYAALSYTWGPELPACHILVDGKLLSVRPNLFYFLRGIRNACFNGWLFIDQVCIDQSNLTERNRQVQLMSAIYRGSKEVIIWLNDDNGDCLKAARAFNEAKSILALSTILSNDYFTRLWIVQEILLSPSLRIFTAGNTWLEWETIWSLTKAVNLGTRQLTPDEATAWSRIPPNTQKLIRMTGNAGQRKGSRELLDILSFSANICFEPRDKVYGLMSLFEVEDRLEVDYQRPLFDVFVDVVMAFHAIIKFDYGRGYIQWLDVTRQVGVNMGIDARDVAAVFGFLELVLPLETRAMRQNRSSPSLVETVGVEITMDTSGLPPRPRATQQPQPSEKVNAEILTIITRARSTIDKSLTQPTSPSPPPQLQPHPPSASQPIARMEYALVSEIHRYRTERLRRDSLANEHRWSFTSDSITELVALQDQGLELSWYYEHEGRKQYYATPPSWLYVLRLPPLTMASIMMQCGRVRGQGGEVSLTAQRRGMGGKTTRRFDRVVRRFVFGRRVWVGLLVAIVGFMGGAVVVSFAAGLDLYTAVVMLGVWGCARIVRGAG